MPLITSTTNLKSLKYETYTQAPYVVTQIPDEPESNGYQLISGLPPLGGVGGNVTDFFRGGFGLPRAVIQDEVRIGKFLTSPQGLLFVGKQQLLSRIGVREQNTVGPLNDGLYNPLSTLASVAGVGIGAYFEKQTQRTYTEKVRDTFSSNTAVSEGNDRLVQLYNGKMFVRGVATNNKSLTISPDDNQVLSYTGGPGAELGIGDTVIPFAGGPVGGYLRTGVNNNDIKQYLYTEVNTSNKISPITYIPTTSGMGNAYLQDLLLEQQLNAPDQPAVVIGPNLFLNAGDNIPSTLLFNPDSVVKPAPVLNLKRIVGNYGVSKQYVLAKGQLIPNGSDIEVFNTTYNAISDVDGRSISTNAVPYNNTAGGTTSNGALTYTQDQLIEASNALLADGGAPTNVVGNNQYNTTLKDFRRALYASLPKNSNGIISNTISSAPDYNDKNVEKRVNLGNPGNPIYNRFYYSKGIDYTETQNGGKSINALDTINAFPIYRAENVNSAQTSPQAEGLLNDLVKFRIAAINNDNPSLKDFMHFRAFLNSFVDNYNPEWNTISYVGRGDKLYTYSGFTRQVTLSWTVVAQSIQELVPMYKKLNYLAANTMPDYSSAGYMRGSLVELTVGAYLFDQPGFINSLTYTANFDAGWEIGINDAGNDSDGAGNIATGTGRTVGVFELPKMIDVSMTFTPIPEFLARKPKAIISPYNAPFTPGSQVSSSLNLRANQGDVNYRPDIDAGLNSRGYIIQQTENYIALTDKGNTFRNY